MTPQDIKDLRRGTKLECRAADAIESAAAALAAKDAEFKALRELLQSAIRIAEEAREEWDAAPSGMRAGKILTALAGHRPKYRADIDAIHAALTAGQRD